MSLDVYLEIKGNPLEPGGEVPSCEVFDGNITHNLGRMAQEAGLYNCLWRPDENAIERAGQLCEPLRQGLERLKADPERYKTLNPENGYGTYEGLLAFAENYLKACRQWPDAAVGVWR